MAGESNVRFYGKENGERISHTPKAKHKDDEGLAKFVWNTEDERYRKLTSGDIFDNDTQQIVPSHATPVRILSAERYWEALAPEGDQENFPSVTQIQNILANDGVVRWQVNNVIQYFMEHIKNMSGIIHELQGSPDPADEGMLVDDEDMWKQFRDGAVAASSPSDAAERGTRFHNAMELWLKGEDWGQALQDEEIEPGGKIIAAIEAELIERHGADYRAMIEQSFINHEQGVAGTADLGILPFVYDYKFSVKTVFGKRGGLLKSNWCYPERALQLANYADGLGIENPTLCNIFCNAETGEVAFYDWPDTQRWLYCSRLLNMFYYMYKVGRLPELGDNTAMIQHALEEWQYNE